MVERNDDNVIHRNVDALEKALRSAGKPHRVIRYDKGGGHELFFTADYYWSDLIRFLREPTER